MSARRLSPNQPKDFKLSPRAKKEIAQWVKKYPKGRQRSALIPALWIAQKDAGGWVPEAALRELADMLDMPYIRVYEVVTFYTMFNLAPVGKFHVQLCGTTPCWLRGSDDLAACLKKRIGPKGSVSEDGLLSWVEVECLGACVNAPMAQISHAGSDEYYEDLTADTLDQLLDNLIAGRDVLVGPQNERHSSEPEGGAQTLNEPQSKTGRKKALKLPHADKAIALTYYEDDPKGHRATKTGRKRKPKRPATTKGAKV